MRIPALLCVVAVTSGGAWATTPEYAALEARILLCAEVREAEARDACLKALAEAVREARRQRARAPTEDPERRVGQWSIYEVKDKMDDTPMAIFSVLSDYYDGGVIAGSRVRFSIACRSGSKSVLLELRKILD